MDIHTLYIIAYATSTTSSLGSCAILLFLNYGNIETNPVYLKARRILAFATFLVAIGLLISLTTRKCLRRSMPDLERPPRLCLLGMEVTGHESAFPDPHALSACLHHPVRHLCKTIPARTTYLPLPLGRSEDRRQVAQTRTGDKRVLPCVRHRPLYAEPRLESLPASRNHRDLPIHRFLFRLRNLLRKLQFHLSGCPNPHP